MSLPISKSRSHVADRIPVHNLTYGVGGSSFLTPTTEVEVMTSDYYPRVYRNVASGRWDVGSPFQLVKARMEGGQTSYDLNANYSTRQKAWQYSTRTPLLPSTDFRQFFDANLNTHEKRQEFVAGMGSVGLSDLELGALGTTAISLTKPTDPAVDMVTTMAELLSERKFFSIPGRSGSLSGEYLNYQFGIAPLISTAEDLRKAIDNADKIVAQFLRDSDRWVRRKFEFDPVVDSTTVVTQGVLPYAPLNVVVHQVGFGELTVNTRTETKSWFSGAFQYHVPKDAIPRRVAELDIVYGVKPGVSTGWELVPFSWLVDYFLPVGHLLGNIDDYWQYGMILPYAYMMSHTVTTSEYQWKGAIRNASGNWEQRTISASLVKERKRRIRASPYGFGVSPGDLTLKQLSILAAVGFSRR